MVMDFRHQTIKVQNLLKHIERLTCMPQLRKCYPPPESLRAKSHRTKEKFPNPVHCKTDTEIRRRLAKLTEF